VAVVTGCSPNHLDWHGSFGHYVAAKQRILAPGQSGQLAVLNTLDPEVASWSGLVRPRRLPLVPDTQTPELFVPGEHNRMNACLAATAARAAGCDQEAIRQGLRSFRALPGRLEMVAVIGGRRFYNDTMATTPESTVAALPCMPSATWLLAGGRDKGSGFGPLADAIVRHSQGAAFFGSVAARLVDEVRSRMPRFRSVAMETMDDAFQWCWRTSRAGDSILLSPACSSLDQFENCVQRGKQFVRLIRLLSERRNTC
jgi:UDP-N-acetylmuramoylalanine--D-glutamate ligase